MSSIWFENTRFSGVQIISYKVDWLALNRVSKFRTAEQKLRYKNYKKIFAPEHQFYVQHYFSNMFLFRRKVLIPSKSSDAARSYCTQKFLKCLKVLIVRVLIAHTVEFIGLKNTSQSGRFWFLLCVFILRTPPVFSRKLPVFHHRKYELEVFVD